jgi:hypothetical protein
MASVDTSSLSFRATRAAASWPPESGHLYGTSRLHDGYADFTLYYFKSNVLAYFELPQEGKWTRFAKMAASSLGVALVMTVIASVL